MTNPTDSNKNKSREEYGPISHLNAKTNNLSLNTYGDMTPKLNRSNDKLQFEIVQKNLEILNLNSMHGELFRAQENKNEIIKEYFKENSNLKNEIAQLKKEVEYMKNKINSMKLEVSYYKSLSESKEAVGIKKIQKQKEYDDEEIINNNYNNKEHLQEKGTPKGKLNKENILSKIGNLTEKTNRRFFIDKEMIFNTKSEYSPETTTPSSPRKSILWQNSKSKNNQDTLVVPSRSPRKSVIRQNSKTKNNLAETLAISPKRLLKIAISRSLNNSGRGSFRGCSDHYKRLALNSNTLSKYENISLQQVINGQKSLFKYSNIYNLKKIDSDLVGKVIHSEEFSYLEKFLVTYDIFKINLESLDSTKLDEIYFLMKGVLNDYKSALILLAKINKLLDVQHIFCERVVIGDIFETICEIVCQTLECDRTTLYLCDNEKREIWSRVVKNSQNIIKLPFGKGLAGFVAEKKTNLVLDDAYEDPRFNKANDIQTGYRTKSVLCVPIFDLNTKEVIGVIQSLNKKAKPNVFDINDEITSELLAKMIGSQLKNSIQYNDYNVHETKLRKLLSASKEFFTTDSFLYLVNCYQDIIRKIVSTDKIQVLINFKDFKPNFEKIKDFTNVDFDTENYYQFKDNLMVMISDNRMKLGVIGNVLLRKKFSFIANTFSCKFYNPTIDINTSLPVITMQIKHPKIKSTIAIVQLEYNVVRLGISNFRITQVDNVDYGIIKLINKILAINLIKFFVKNINEK